MPWLNWFFISHSGTSDSSIYYPKRRNKSTLQEILDEKAAHLFHKKCKRTDSDDEIITKRGGGGGVKKKDKAKHRRKYLSENKVGSVEEAVVQCHSPPDDGNSTSSSDFAVEEVVKAREGSDKKNNERPVDKMAAVSNYHKNKLLHEPKFVDRSDTDDIETYYSKHTSRHHHQDDETGSIGSYLSMISIRSFPK